jgi:hypothetical protein
MAEDLVAALKAALGPDSPASPLIVQLTGRDTPDEFGKALAMMQRYGLIEETGHGWLILPAGMKLKES